MMRSDVSDILKLLSCIILHILLQMSVMYIGKSSFGLANCLFNQGLGFLYGLCAFISSR